MMRILDNGLNFRQQLKSDIVDTAITGGLSLEMGSAAYKEYLYDIYGLNEQEQDNLLLDKSKFRDVIDKTVDEMYEIYNEANSQYSHKLNVKYIAMYNKGFSAMQKNIRQNLKRVYMKQDLKIAEQEADKTPTLDDDSYVKRVLEPSMKKGIYDDGVSIEDYAL